ncbi:MAG: GDSL-type esterase/lipase family protein [Bacteroidales bacterium]
MKRYLPALILIFFISCSPVRTYRNLPEVRAWETEIQKFETLDKNNDYPENSVLFTGSSSIRLWESLSEDMSPYPVIQRGYGGAKLSDYLVYADRIIYPHKASAIVIFIANDISGSESDKSPRQVAKLFKHLVKLIRKEYPDVPVFWISITPSMSRWAVWPKIREANNLIRDYCEKNNGTYFIATESLFLNERGTPRNELFQPDLLHLNPGGYKIWTGIIKEEIDRVLMQ